MGASVVAADNGTVIDTYNSCYHNWGKNGSCGCNGGYGNYVMIDHGNGKVTVYGHFTNVIVSPGQTVKKGQTIGYVGSTGNSTGPHLHFECRYNGVKYNPMTEYE
ncbi:MAG: M23 family metallopeptidase [Ruminococcus bromii]|nr:M23 family metallopeptidase [Ruminococcus bromii]MCI7211157.1 M23 family metallopeptidase [Ruminococcus bromii]